MKNLAFHAVTAVALLCCAVQVFAGEETLDIDTKFRAKIAKEKVKQGFNERQADAAGKGIDNATCGSQNIGNVNTGGRPGAAPREVFVFAPNAINLVTGNGCR